jgi:hypothetical protein
MLVAGAFLFMLCFCAVSHAGHEVLYNTQLAEGYDIQPHELAIIQYDSRPLGDYWNSSAYWNYAFAQKWGHLYLFISGSSAYEDEIGDIGRVGDAITSSRKTRKGSNSSTSCHHFKGVTLSPVWCKVKAMIKAKKYLPMAKAFLYLDSDIAITVSNHSLTDVMSFMRKSLNWDYNEMPMAFNQDGPGWACKHTIQDVGYPFCFNSGTVLWFRNVVSQKILTQWWNLAAQPYSESKFDEPWRDKWPWEQAQMYPIYESFYKYIMRLSFPHEPFLPWKSTKNPKAQYPTDTVEPWCFSHWPGADCFITHFCGSNTQKRRLRDEYLVGPQKDGDLPVMKMY